MSRQKTSLPSALPTAPPVPKRPAHTREDSPNDGVVLPEVVRGDRRTPAGGAPSGIPQVTETALSLTHSESPTRVSTFLCVMRQTLLETVAVFCVEAVGLTCL